MDKIPLIYGSMLAIKILASVVVVLLLGGGVFGVSYYWPKLQPENLVTYQNPVTSQPTSLNLDVTNPDDGILVFEKAILVSGKTSANSQILISSPTNDVVVGVKEDGSFSNLFDLNVGLNPINITVFNSLGEEKTTSRTIFYSKEKL